jgi:ribosomal protein L29
MPNNRLAKASREDLKGLNATGLRAKLDETRLKLWQLQFSLGKRQLENTAELANTRKQIARILTYLNQLEAK